MRQLSTISLIVFAAACGGGSKNNNPTVDAPGTTIDAPASATCTTPAAFGAQDIADDEAANGQIVWSAPVTTDLGDGGDATVTFEFFQLMPAADLTQPTDLATGIQNNYATCAACVRLETTDSSGMAKREYFQSGGTLQLTSDPFTSEKMIGTIKGLVMDEVTIDSSNMYTSTPVVGGKCVLVGDITLNHDQIPNSYTCAKATYGDGASCNCACGSVDPDCNDGTLAVAGCTTATPLCGDDGMCAARPTCTVNATLGTPTLTTPTATYDGSMETEYTANVNADATPDQIDIQLWDGSGVFSAGVAPGTYQLTGAELDYNTCGACVQLYGDVDATNGPAQFYMAKSGTLNLTSTATTITGTLTNATFGAIKFDGNQNQVPDGSNCVSAVTTANFTSPITTMFTSTKSTKVNVHIMHGKKPAHAALR